MIIPTLRLGFEINFSETILTVAFLVSSLVANALAIFAFAVGETHISRGSWGGGRRKRSNTDIFVGMM